MWTEQDIKNLKRQEQEALRQATFAGNDVKALKAAKADERARARAERAAAKTAEHSWKAIQRAEQYEAAERWKQQQVDHHAKKQTAKDARKEAREWADDTTYYSEGEQPRGCWRLLSLSGFTAFAFLLLVAMYLLAQVAANR